jgi:hypothetical protein
LSKFGTVIVSQDGGPPCPRCGHSTQVREHAWLGDRELQKAFHLKYWYYCANARCAANFVAPPEEARVYHFKQEDIALEVLDAMKPENTTPPWED